jgi:hypothetical protein
MHVLVGLMTHAIESPLVVDLVPLVHLVLAYRFERELIELLRKRSGQVPGHQPVRSARGRHARRH